MPATKRDMAWRVIRAAARAGAKSLGLSALVMGPGFALLMSDAQVAGMIWLFVGSFALMAWTYRRPWRIGVISGLMPPLAAGFCYLVQLALFGAHTPPAAVVAAAVGAGLLFGALRARTHTLRRDPNGAIVAERTLGYLVVWVLSYGITQGLALVAANVLIVRAGLVTGAFTTGALAALSFMLLTRRSRLLKGAPAATVLLLMGGLFGTPTPASAQQTFCWSTAPGEDGGRYVVSHGDSRSMNFCTFVATCDIGPLPNGSFMIGRNYVRDIAGRGGTPTRAQINATLCQILKDRFPDSAAAFGTAPDSSSSSGSAFGLPSVESLMPRMESLLDDNGPVVLPSEDLIALTTALTIALVGAGFAVNVAQAVAAAIAQAAQAGVQLTAEDIQRVVTEALLGQRARAPAGDIPHRPSPSSSTEPSTASSTPRSSAPPNVRFTERVGPPPPVYDEDGKPFPTNEEGQYWGPDEKGNWRWLSRREAEQSSYNLRQQRAEQDRQAAESDRRGREEAARSAAEQTARNEAEREAEAQARAAREEAFAGWQSADEAATNRGDIDILLRSDPDRVYNDDGSIDTEYLERMRAALRGRMRRDQAAPDEDLANNSWSRIIHEAGEQSMEDASNSFWARAGLGWATGGWSEAVFQGRGVYNTIRTAAEDATDHGQDMSFSDGVRLGAGKFAEDNLPVNTIQAAARAARGEEVSGAEIFVSLVADAAALMDVHEGVQRIGATGGRAADAIASRIESAVEAAGGNPSGRLGVSHAQDRLAGGRLTTETEDLISGINNRRSGSGAELDAAHATGQGRGTQRVQDLENAVNDLQALQRSPNASFQEVTAAQRKVRDQVIRIQADKHGMNALNARAGNTGDPLVRIMNQEMQAIYREADAVLVQRLAERYGVRPEDIEIVNISNQPGSTWNRVDSAAPPRDHMGLGSRRTADGSIEGSRAAASEAGSGAARSSGPAGPVSDRKVSFDRDLTMRVRTIENGKVVYRDVPSTVTASTYNDVFYEAATGRTAPPRTNLDAAGNPRPDIDFINIHPSAGDYLGDPAGITDPDIFARRLDQATTHRLHPEAYGTGQADLDTATKDAFRHRDLTDVGAVAQTIEFKVTHWMNDADRLRGMAEQATDPAVRRELLEQSTAHVAEAQRQLTKQYENMVLKRTAAMQSIGNAPGARIPTKLSEGINVLKQVQSGRLTPSQADDVLRAMGTDTRQLASQMSSYVEGLEKLRPSAPPTRPSVVFQGWQDEFQNKEASSPRG